MADWAQLLPDLLALIAGRIHILEDFMAFRGVCKPWRSVAVKENIKGSRNLWLMLAEDEGNPDQRRFVSVTNNNYIHTVTLPEARGKKCLESLGWLLTVAEDGELNLLNPFSRVQVSLPHLRTLKYYYEGELRTIFVNIQKAVLSSSPDESNDYTVMVMYGNVSHLAFWRCGDKGWTTIETHEGCFCDILYYNQNFHGVSTRGLIYACDTKGENPTVAHNVGRIHYLSIDCTRPYLVESAGALLVILRDSDELLFLDDDPILDYENIDESRIDYKTKEFLVFEVDLNKRSWTQKMSLGDNVALFVGDNASICIDISKFPGIKGNCIYFTDDCWEAYLSFNRGGGKDMGIYNLEDRSLIPHYRGQSFSRISPPMWVTPSGF